MSMENRKFFEIPLIKVIIFEKNNQITTISGNDPDQGEWDDL